MGKELSLAMSAWKGLKVREMGKISAQTNLTLPATFSARLLNGARKVHLDAGRTLFLIGDPGDGCYWVEKVC